MPMMSHITSLVPISATKRPKIAPSGYRATRPVLKQCNLIAWTTVGQHRRTIPSACIWQALFSSTSWTCFPTPLNGQEATKPTEHFAFHILLRWAADTTKVVRFDCNLRLQPIQGWCGQYLRARSEDCPTEFCFAFTSQKIVYKQAQNANYLKILSICTLLLGQG